jgi:SNF2 family DNA or RNA helicase
MTVFADYENGRIITTFPFSPAAVVNAKSVVGAKFDGKSKSWSYPASVETCHALRRAHGKALKIGERLAVWFRGEIMSRDGLKALNRIGSSAELEKVPRWAPKLSEAIAARNYQAAAVKFATMAGNVLIADQPGLGKTAETLGALVEGEVSGPVLVVAPRTSLRATWEPEIAKWLEDYELGFTVEVVDAQTGSKPKREKAIAEYMELIQIADSKMHFLCVNPEMLRANKRDGKIVYDYPQFGEVNWSAIVVDESHRYLLNANPRSKKCSKCGLGLSKLESSKRIALSGTPMKGKPRRIWHTLRWLEPEKYPSEWNWSKLYFQTAFSPYSATGEEITDTIKPEMEKAFADELAGRMIRRTKSELRQHNSGWAPPDKMYHEIWLPMSDKQKKAYLEIEKNAETELDGKVLTANGVLAILTRLKQFATASGKMESGEFFPDLPSNKIDWLIDDFIPSRENKIVVASQFSKVIDLVESELAKARIECFKLTGAVSDEKRRDMISSFQESPTAGPRIFLLTTTAGGVSVTLDMADDLVMLDETWVPDDQEQVEDRIHRTSRVSHQVNIYYVRSLETVEQAIMHSVSIKDETQKRVLDGSRGIDYAKQRFNAQLTDKGGKDGK